MARAEVKKTLAANSNKKKQRGTCTLVATVRSPMYVPNAPCHRRNQEVACTYSARHGGKKWTGTLMAVSCSQVPLCSVCLCACLCIVPLTAASLGHVLDGRACRRVCHVLHGLGRR